MFNQPPDRNIEDRIEKAVHLGRSQILLKPAIEGRPAIVKVIMGDIKTCISRQKRREAEWRRIAEAQQKGRPWTSARAGLE